MIEDKRILDFIENNAWRVSKDGSHSYCVHYLTSPQRIDFEYFVTTIREKGYKERWHHYNHTYLNIGGFKYWSMGNPIPETIIINRVRI